jgi:hypothetical protein
MPTQDTSTREGAESYYNLNRAVPVAYMLEQVWEAGLVQARVELWALV